MTETQKLLAEYVSRHSEEAFREIVARYINLVYSTALRALGGDAHLAEDVAQTVFLRLARKAQALPADIMLGGWLHRDTCHLAADVVRSERRRRTRERQAMETTHQQDHSEANLARLLPILDEAIDHLGTQDRQAILLRFFDQHGLRSIGEVMGTSEDAAQKRVRRALDELRGLLARRGIVLSAAVLASVLAAQGAKAAPAALAATISASAFTGIAQAGGPLTHLLKLAMLSKVQTGLVGLVFLASISAPLVIQHLAQSRLRERDTRLRARGKQLADLAAENQRLAGLLARRPSFPSLAFSREHELLRLRGQIGLLNRTAQELEQLTNPPVSATKDSLEAREQLWAARLDRLKAWVAANPSEQIPELELLSQHDWLDSVGPHVLDSTEHCAQAMSNVRDNAQLRALDKLGSALRKYVHDSNGQFPAELSQLKPYLDPAINDSMLQRYELAPSTNLVPELQGHGSWVITQKAPINAALDSRFAQGLDGGGAADDRVTNRWAFTQ
jgi:RNA polymerase sigma factor (sigma-70 family)